MSNNHGPTGPVGYVMPILDRIRRLARANILHLLNQAETPEDEVAAKIAELESASQDAKDALASFAVTYKRLEKNVAALTETRAEWQARAETALRQGDEHTARLALGERLKTEERLAALEPVLQSRRLTYDELKENLLSIHDQLSLVRSRLMDLRARRQAAEAEKTIGRRLEAAGRHGADGGFERLEDAVAEAEAQTEIERELRGATTPLDEKLQREAQRRNIDRAMEALRRRVAGGGTD